MMWAPRSILEPVTSLVKKVQEDRKKRDKGETEANRKQGNGEEKRERNGGGSLIVALVDSGVRTKRGREAAHTGACFSGKQYSEEQALLACSA
jgi:hypothetical protein